jgi:hypothetical protein
MCTKVVRLSEIGSSSSQIKNYITDAYDNWQIKPEFLLLVGAPNYIPFPMISWTYTDNYYTNMDSDIYNEILSGRLTVHSTTEAQTVVNKILSYERAPYMEDSLWFINTCLIVNEDNDPCDDSIYWSDVHHAKELMREARYNIIDTLCDRFADDKYDVIDCVNNGRGFVLYRGQGVGNWYSPFDVNPDQTANGEKLPIVLSITCRTIGTSSTPATAEKWLLTGYPTMLRGASGYFATTTTLTQAAYLRSAVCKGFFNAIFVDGKKTFGEACEQGRTQVYNQYFSQDEYRGFTTIGDPEMNIWTAIPRNMDVTYKDIISLKSQEFTVEVVYEEIPIRDAVVCLMKDEEIYEVDSTDVNGMAIISIDPLSEGTMDVTVTAKNYLPHEGTCQINKGLMLIPDAINVSRGGQLGYTAILTNTSNSSITIEYWTDIILWNGNPYAGNPIFGPFQATIGPGETKQDHLNHGVPLFAPLQTYTCYGRVGWFPNQVWDEDSFEFTIIETEQ